MNKTNCIRAIAIGLTFASLSAVVRARKSADKPETGSPPSHTKALLPAIAWRLVLKPDDGTSKNSDQHCALRKGACESCQTDMSFGFLRIRR